MHLILCSLLKKAAMDCEGRYGATAATLCGHSSSRWLPGLVRVVKLHFLYDFEGIGTQIFLVYDSVVAHDECLHSRHAILGRHGDQREAANHDSLDDIVNFAQRRSWTLTLQNLEVVAVKASLAS